MTAKQTRGAAAMGSSGSGEALSEARLVKLRQRVRDARADASAEDDPWALAYSTDVADLLAREAALGAFVERVAKGPHWAIDLFTLQEQARALLASAAEPAANAQGEVEATYPVVDELDQLAEHDARWEALTNDPYGEHYRTVKRDTEF